ncbi:MAG TPA: HIRAN domain-containing protein [Jiangellaceae bacterium]|nr:HIRAN domain-containing protein [Jiangellaceae bacterium]
MGLWSWLTGRGRREDDKPRPAVVLTVRAERLLAVPDLGVVRRSEWLPREREERSFVLGPDGMPTGRLRHERDRWVIFTDDGAGMVNPSSARLHTLGLYCFRIRGVTYHEGAVTAGNFRPGTRVRLVREPGNEHDPNAIAVYAPGADRPAGYVNKLNAKRLTKRLEAGDKLTAISVRGTRPGEIGPAPWVLVASTEIISHLLRGPQP